MIAASALAWKTDEFVFLTKSQIEQLIQTLSAIESGTEPGGSVLEAEPLKLFGRFCLRRVKCNDDSGPPVFETRLHFILAELRSGEQLVKRTETILQNLARWEIFRGLIATGVFGFTIVVPSNSAKASLERLPLLSSGSKTCFRSSQWLRSSSSAHW